MTRSDDERRPRILGPDEGEILGAPESVTDRFMLNAEDSEGRFALIEHGLAPRALAAPLHLHESEDEYSFILEGRVGVVLGDHEVFLEEGDFLVKPRGQWHTFWNAGDSRARILEIISPAGLEELFREMDLATEAIDPETLAEMAARFGAQVDFERTLPIIEKHNLAF